jgi:hypothetical protein
MVSKCRIYGSEAETSKRFGGDWEQTMVEATAAARVEDFFACYGASRRAVVDFSEWYWVATDPDLNMAMPDFDNAVSTFCVRGESSGASPPSHVFLRAVTVVTLAELYENYRHDAEWKEIYNAFLDGRVIYRKRVEAVGHIRGRAGGQKRKHGW